MNAKLERDIELLKEARESWMSCGCPSFKTLRHNQTGWYQRAKLNFHLDMYNIHKGQYDKLDS